MSDAIISVTEAKGLAQSIDETMSIESHLIEALIGEMAEVKGQIEMARDQYLGANEQLERLKTYFKSLSELMAKNEMPSNNEAQAASLSESSAQQAKALETQAEETLVTLNAASLQLVKLKTMNVGLLTEMTALNGQIIIVTTR